MPNAVLVYNLKIGGCGFVGYDDEWSRDGDCRSCPSCHKCGKQEDLETFRWGLIEHLPKEEQDKWTDRAFDLWDRQMMERDNERARLEELEFKDWESSSWSDLEDEEFRHPRITLSRRQRRRIRRLLHMTRRMKDLCHRGIIK